MFALKVYWNSGYDGLIEDFCKVIECVCELLA